MFTSSIDNLTLLIHLIKSYRVMYYYQRYALPKYSIVCPTALDFSVFAALEQPQEFAENNNQ